jgi:hypothetical protein
MAYSAPELLLVGAAQNLVLGGSDDNLAGACRGKELEDGVNYDSSTLW